MSLNAKKMSCCFCCCGFQKSLSNIFQFFSGFLYQTLPTMDLGNQFLCGFYASLTRFRSFQSILNSLHSVKLIITAFFFCSKCNYSKLLLWNSVISCNNEFFFNQITESTQLLWLFPQTEFWRGSNTAERRR